MYIYGSFMVTYGCNHMLIHCGYYIVYEPKFYINKILLSLGFYSH
jgi:hypothetical protein